MNFILKKIKKKIKEFQKSYSEIKYYKSNEPVIYVKLKPNTKVRTYLNLIFHLQKVYSQPIVVSFTFLNLFILAKWFSKIDNLYLESPFKKIKIFRRFSYKKNTDFKIDYNYNLVYDNIAYMTNVVPYIMHPQNYQTLTNRHAKKHIGIIISGNFDEKIYNDPTLKKRYGLINRSEIYNKIISLQDTKQITGTELIERYKSDTYLNNTVLMKWQLGAIPSPQWRYYLSASKFLFCAPGMTMPLCHNVIEALSVGTVPIINYKDWLNPSLEDGVNCIVYSTVDSIPIAIERALSLNKENYEKMQENCLKYFSEFYEKFDFENLVDKIITLVNEDPNDLPDSQLKQ